MLEIERNALSVSSFQWKAMKIILMLAAVMIGYYCLFGNTLTDPTNAEEILEQHSKIKQTNSLATNPLSELQVGYLSIPSVNINSKITEVGVNENHAVDVPETDIGWFNISAKPNQPGVVFLDGHNPGPLNGLDKVEAGENISIHLNDNSVVNYIVHSVRTADLSGISMFELLVPPSDLSDESQFLVLMTCAGEFDDTKDTYNQRTIVMAERLQH